ncbi:pyroglutamyl-peptidase I [Arenimonas sp. GDDSR-1]|uniref:pyroglutamyl-peptidase I n=1 Tax=Arenimonas sp. GDDSR-1 TaxID=2950125 RepID=UPI00261D7BB2|nr:pyroglutamyl-peptidase I [Arenimonas sp. GDDSR-1]
MKILMTGFDAFGGESINPSWLSVQRVCQEDTDGLQLIGACLPTEFSASLARLQELVECHRPDLVIAVGQAGGRSAISLERIAINIDDARIPDNAGWQPIDEPIHPAGEAAYFSTLPIKAIVHALRSEGIPAEVSNSAGTYVCNHVFYGLMHLCRHIPGMRAGFVHIPYLPEQAAKLPGAPSMALDVMVRALSLIVRTALHAKTDLPMIGGTEC